MRKKVYYKKVFSHHDFNIMGWHDCKIHALSFNDLDFELLLDIDYILEWKKSDDTEYYSFEVSAATLKFKNVWDLNINIEGELEMRIEDIYRSNPRVPQNNDFNGDLEYDWKIETSNGYISFKSIGYVQYMRGKIFKSDNQAISLVNRGGISFSQI